MGEGGTLTQRDRLAIVCPSMSLQSDVRCPMSLGRGFYENL